MTGKDLMDWIAEWMSDTECDIKRMGDRCIYVKSGVEAYAVHVYPCATQLTSASHKPYEPTDATTRRQGSEGGIRA